MDDVLEKIIFFKQNDLPDDTDQRTLFLNQLITYPFFYIYYEDMCKYSKSFQTHYSPNHIKTLLRKHNILGNNVQSEISHCSASDEDKALLRFFFKGKVV